MEDRCPRRLILEEPQTVSKLFSAFRLYTDGYLPEDGSVTDQPSNLMLALQDISLAKGYLDNEDAKSEQEGNTEPPAGFRSVIRKD